MTERHQNQPTPGSEIILYQTEDGRNRIEVRLENETVWLTQQLMAELFQTTKQNVSLHIKNIFEEGELGKGPVVKEFLTVQQEGSRKLAGSGTANLETFSKPIERRFSSQLGKCPQG